MLIELNKSRLAAELAGANDSIVALLRKAAAATEVSSEEVLADWPHAGGPARAKVEAVLELPLEDRRALADAVAADLDFEAGGDGYEFAFLELNEATRKAGKGLMGSMYEDVFGRGRFLLENGEEGNRRSWEDAFRAANPDLRVCPACLAGLLETRIDGRSAIDLDHYLPKSFYPPLTIHGPNLVPLCSRCNSRAKGEKDPLQDGEERRELSSVWFPFAGAGLDEAHLAFDLLGDAQVTVQLEGTGPGKQRAENFDALFQVSKKWSELLEGAHNTLCGALSARAAAAGGQLSVDEIKTELAYHQSGAASARLSNPGSFVTECYCEWLRSDRRALEAFADAVANFPPPPVGSSSPS